MILIFFSILIGLFACRFLFIQMYSCACCDCPAMYLHFFDCFLHTQSGSITPLHQAAEKGHYDIVAVLLSYNANGTIKDQV